MAKSERLLQQDVEEVFALTLNDEAIESSREVVKRYLSNNAGMAGTVKWAEFNFSGKHIRSGISQATSMSTRLITDWSDDSDVSHMVAIAENSDIKAGLLMPGANTETFVWFVPYTPADPSEMQATRLKAVLITEQLIKEIIDLFNQEAGLTKSESRMVFQIVTGLHPREAATVDQVSIETKRLHLKNACSKLHCSGQSELMRLMVGQMVHILYMCEAETSHMQATEKFTADFLGNDARLSVQRLFNGRLLRVWEFGPTDGRPVLMIHGFLFPFVLLNLGRELERHGIRLIVPIRSGYLDDQTNGELFYEGKLIDQTTEDLVAFIQQTWQKPIPVLGHATGGIFAMAIAKKYPDLFKKIVVTSINLLPVNDGKKSLSSNFLGGIRKLANEAGIFEWLTKQYLRTTFSNEKTTRFVLRRLFRDCDTDLHVLNGRLGSGPCFDWYRRFHATSLLGIPSDFKLMSGLTPEILNDLPQPTTFLHGEMDAMTEIGLVQDFTASNADVQMEILPDTGHLVAASHPELFWNAIARAI